MPEVTQLSGFSLRRQKQPGKESEILGTDLEQIQVPGAGLPTRIICGPHW